MEGLFALGTGSGMTHRMKMVKPWRLALVVAVLMLAYALSLYQPVRAWYSSWDKLAHAVVFAGVYIALAWALRWRPMALTMVAASMGAAVEALQMFLPGFSPSMWDWLADLVGIGLASLAMTAWRKRGAA